MREEHSTEEWTQLHVNKFPPDIKKTMEDWAAAQVPDQTLRQVVITACQEWLERNVKQQPDDQARQAKIEDLERQIEELKRKG